MAENTMTPAPRTEKYQAIQDGFDNKYYYKGNFKTFNEGELVPSWFKPVSEIVADAEAAMRPETQKPPKADRPTMQDAGIVKPTATPPQAEQSNEGRPGLEDAGIVKAKATVDAKPPEKVEPTPEVKPEKVKAKVKKKAKKKVVKKKAAKKK